MKRIFLVLLLAVSAAAPARAEPPHGTIVSLNLGGDRYAVQFWPVSGKVMVARRDEEVGKGAFPATTATALARAALARHGMECALQTPQLYNNVPGLWDVFYRC